MIGIYKYTNNINGKVYIGQSINLEQRKYAHKSSAFNEKVNDYDSQFHQAIRKYGIENFTYEVIAEISEEEYSKAMLDDLEKYFIKYYDSYEKGYNATEGGDENPNRAQSGEKNGRALLKESDVKYIRECYNAHIPFKQVYKEYEDKISKRGFQKIWWFETWKNIYPEYHSEENKYWHSHQAKANSSKIAANNKRKFSDEEIKNMRYDYDNGMSPKEVWQKYSPNSAWSTIYNIITRQTYKEIE